MIDIIVDDGIAVITINRPDKANCLSQADKKRMGTAVQEVANDGAVQSIVVTGAGERSFCAGSDIAEMSGLEPLTMRDMLADEHEMYQAILTSAKPVVAAINGAAMGAGLILAMTADYAVAAERARFGSPELTIGASVPLEGLLLPWLVGLSTARAMFYLGQPVDGRSALQRGLINEVVPDHYCLDRAIAVARQIASLPGQGFQVQKEFLYRLLMTGDMDAVIRESLYATSFQLHDAETRSALNAFRSGAKSSKDMSKTSGLARQGRAEEGGQ